MDDVNIYLSFLAPFDLSCSKNCALDFILLTVIVLALMHQEGFIRTKSPFLLIRHGHGLVNIIIVQLD